MRLSKSLLAAAAFSVTAVSMYAAVATKSSVGTDLTGGTAAVWTGGQGALGSPNYLDVATWTVDSLGAGLVVGSNVNWGSIDISGALSDISISGAGSITTGNITLSGTRMLNITNAIVLGGNVTYDIGDVTTSSAVDMTLSGSLSGTGFGLTKRGAGTLLLTGNPGYTGLTTINQGTLEIRLGNTGTAPGGITLAGGTLKHSGGGYLVIGTQSAANNGLLNVSANSAIEVENNGSSNQLFFDGGTTGSGALTITNYSAPGVLSTGTTGVHFRDNYTTNNYGQTYRTGATTVIGGYIAFSNNTGNVSLANSNLTLNAAILEIGTGQFSITNTVGVTVNSLNGNGTSTVRSSGVSNTLTIGINGGTGGNFAGVISGGTSIVKTGSGIQTFSGANNYTGATTINVNGGTLLLGHATALGTTAGGTLVNAGGTLDLSGQAVGTEALTLNGTGVNSAGALINSGTAASYAGTVALATDSSIGGTGNMTIGGIISNGGSPVGPRLLTKVGTGTLTLTAANTYTGGTTLAGGTLVLGNANALGTAGAITFAGGTLAYTGVTTDLSLRFTSGARPISVDTATGLTVNFATKLSSGATSLTKSGAGTLVLIPGGTIANDYTGATLITGGTLRAGNANAFSAGSAFDVRTGATLDLNNFNESIGGLTGAGNVTLGTGNLTVNQTVDGTLSGTITATSGRLIKNGAATLALAPTGTNTLSNVTVNAGTLGLGVNAITNPTGTITLTGDALAGGTLRYEAGNTTDYSSRITSSSTRFAIDTNAQNISFGTGLTGTGPASLTKSGAGTLTLSVANAYTGVTTINGGVLKLGNAAALGATGINSGTVINTGGSLDLNGFTGVAESLTLAGGALINDGLSPITITSADPVTFSATSSLGGSGDMNFASAISGNLGLTKVGTGVLTLSGTNGYTGLTTVNAGTLRLGGAGVLGATGVNSGTQVNTGGIVDLNGQGTIAEGFTLAGGSLVNTGTAVTLSGTVAITTASSLGGAGNISLAGVVSGAGSLTYTGGTLTLSGANTYSGGTTVAAGMVVVTGASALGTGAVAVNFGATLDLTALPSVTLGGITGTGTVNFGTNANLTFTATAPQINDVTVALGGSGSVTKIGNGTIVFKNTNGYSGLTTISAGTLQIGDAGTAGSLGSGNVLVESNGTLSFVNPTAPSAGNLISGTGAVVYAGTGVFQLTGANTYDGLTTVASGTLQLNASGKLGSTVAGTIVASGATLDLNGVNNVGESLTLAGGTLANTVSTAATSTAALTLTSDSTVDTTGDITVSGAVSGTGSLSKTGTGTLELKGANNYSGGTNLIEGTLRAGSTTAFGSGLLSVSPGGIVDLNGFNVTVGGLAGGGDVNLGASTLTSNVGTGVTATYAGSLSGTGGFTKIGAGTQVFDGASTYSGVTTVSGGTLRLGNDAALGATGVNSGTRINTGGTVDLNGHTVAEGFTLAGGTLANSSATLATVSGNIAINSASTVDATGDMTLSGIVSGNGQLTKSGAGVLLMSAANTYTGGTMVLEGTLRAGSATAFGTGTVFVADGATLDLGEFALTNVFSGGGSFDISNTTLTIGGSASQVFAGNITSVNDDGIISSPTDGSNLRKIGNGTSTLTGDTIDYAGRTIVEGGTLRIGGSSSLGSGFYSGDISIAQGATFEYGSTSSQVLGGMIDSNFDLVPGGGVISGAGDLALTGTGFVSIFGNNTYTGRTRIGTGFVSTNSVTALGVNSSVSMGGGSLSLNSDLTIGTLSGSGSVSVGDHTLRLTGSAGTPVAYFDGSIDAAIEWATNSSPTAPATTPVAGSYILDSNTFERVQRVAAGRIVKEGSGGWEITNFSLNLEGATLEVNGGELRVTNPLFSNRRNFNSFNSIAGDVAVTTGTFTDGGVLLGLNDDDQFLHNASIGRTLRAGEYIDFNGNRVYVADPVVGPASVILGAGARLSFQGTLSGYAGGNDPVNGNLLLRYNGVSNLQAHRDSELHTGFDDNYRIAVHVAPDATSTVGIISGSGRLFKTGAGTLTVLNDSTFTGDVLLARGLTILDSGNGRSLASAASVNLGNDGNDQLADGTNGIGTGRASYYRWNQPNVGSFTSAPDFSGWGAVSLQITGNETIGSLQIYRDPVAQTNSATRDAEELVTGVDANYNWSGSGHGLNTSIDLGSNTLTVNQTVLGWYSGNILGSTGGVLLKQGSADLVLNGAGSAFDTLNVAQGRVISNVSGLGSHVVLGEGATLVLVQPNFGTLSAVLDIAETSTLQIGIGANLNGTALKGDNFSGAGTFYFDTTTSGAVAIANAQPNLKGTVEIFDGIKLTLVGNALASAKAIIIRDSLVALGGNGRETEINFADTDQTLSNLQDMTVTGNDAAGYNSFARIHLGSGSLTLNQKDTDLVYAGQVTGTGALIKTGAKIAEFKNVLTYSGATVVENGTVKGALANTFSRSSALVVTSAGTFDGNGKDQSFGALFGTDNGKVVMGAGNLTIGMTSTAEAAARAGTFGTVHGILSTDQNTDASVPGSARTQDYLKARYAEAVDTASASYTAAAAAPDTASGVYTDALTESARLTNGIYTGAVAAPLTTDSTFTSAQAAPVTSSPIYTAALASPVTTSSAYANAFATPNTSDSAYVNAYNTTFTTRLAAGDSVAAATATATTAAKTAYASKTYAAYAYAADAYASKVYATHVYAADTYAASMATSMSFGGTISGTGKLIKIGSQTLTLTGKNTYTGDTLVQGGKLVVDGDALYLGSATTGKVLVSAGATLAVDAAFGEDYIFNSAVYGGANATFEKLGLGTVELDGSKFFLADDAGNAIAGSYAGNMRISAGTLRFNTPTDGSVTGAFTGAGTLEKTGLGTLTLANTTGFSGDYSLKAGSLTATTAAITLSNNVTFGTDAAGAAAMMTFSVAGAGAHTYTGAINGAGTVRFTGQDITLAVTQDGFTGMLSAGAGTTITAGVADVAKNAKLDLTGVASPLLLATFSDGGLAQTFKGITGNAQGVYQLGGTTTLDIGTGNAVSYAGQITGTGTIVVASGRQTLTTTTANTGWTGGLIVNTGAFMESTVQAISSLTTTTINGELDILVASGRETLTTNYTGTGTLGKTGEGTLVLSGNNYAGVLKVIAGTVEVDASSRFGNVYLNTEVSRGATYSVLLGATAATQTGLAGLVGEGNLALSGPFTVTLTAPQGTGALAHTGNILLADRAILNLAANGVTTLNGLGSTTDTVGSPNGAAAGTVVSGADLTIAQSAAATYRGVFSGLQNLTVTAGNDTAHTAGTLTYDNGVVPFALTNVTVNSGGLFTTTGTLDVLNNVSVDGTGSVLTIGGDLTGVANLLISNGGTLRILGKDLGTGTVSIVDSTISLTSMTGSRTYDLTRATLDLNVVNASDTLVLDNFINVLAPPSTLSKSGDGTLIVNSTGSFNGNLLINAGTMQINSTTAFGTTNTVGTITVKRDATVPLTGGTLNLNGNSLTGTTLTTEVGSTIALGSAGTSTLTVTDGTVAGAITGTGSFVKTGSGTLTYGANDVFADTVAVTISGGTLNLNGFSDNLGSLTSAGNIALGSGTLGVQSGSISGTITGTGGLVKNTDGSSNGGTLTVTSVGNSFGFATVNAGTLALTGTTTISGATLVNGGTLALSSGSFTTGTLNTAGTGVVALTGANLTVNTGSFEATLNGGGTIALGTSTMTVSQSGTFSGTMTGSGNLVKNGAGTTLTLSGANNKLTSATVNAGTLAFTSVGNTVGTLTGTGVVDLGAAARLTLQPTAEDTFAGTFTGSGEMTKIGTASFIVTGDSTTFTGKVTVNAGILQIGNGGTTGSLGSAALVNNSTVLINRSDAVTIGNAISGTGSLIKANTNTVILTGNNTYAGTTSIQAGTLQIGNGGTTGTLGSLANPGSVVNSGALVFNRSDSLTVGNAISGSGSVTQSGGANSTVTLSGANTYTGNTGVTSGKLVVKTASLPQGTFSSTDTGSLTFDGTGVATIAKDISGTAAVNFSGAGGKTTLSGSFTNTGNFTVLSGHTLNLGTDDTHRATLATQHLLVSAGATLGGSGSFAGHLTNAGTLTPGFSPGVVNIAGDFTNTGTLNMEIAGNGAAGAADGHDLINFGGTAFLGGTLNVTFTNGFTPAVGSTTILLQDTDTADGKPSFSGNFVSVPLSTGMLVNTGSGIAYFNGNSLSQVLGLTSLHEGVDAFAAALSPTQGVVNPAFGRFLLLSNDPAALAIALQNASPVGLAALTAMPVNEVHKDTESLRRRAESQAMAAYSPFGDDADWLTYLGGSGGTTNFDEKSSLPTFDMQSFGGLAGIERRLGDGGTSIGVRLGYDRGTATLHQGGGKVDQNHARVGLYGTTLLGEAGYLTGGVGMGYSSYETKRNTISGVQKASPTGWDASASVDAGYIMRLNKEWSLTPHAGISAVAANVGGFTEKGSDLALAVDSYSQTSVRTRIGTGLFREWNAKNFTRNSVRFGLDLAYEHELMDDAVKIPASFAGFPQGGSFKSESAVLVRDTISVGPQLVWTMDESRSISAGYRFEYGIGGSTGNRVDISFEQRF